MKEGEKPESIKQAIGHLHALVLYQGCLSAWGINILFSILYPPVASQSVLFLTVFVLMLAFPALASWWLTHNIKQAKSWARSAYAIFSILYFFLYALEVYAEQHGLLPGIFNQLSICFLGGILSLLPLFHLYRKDSNAWFKPASQT